MERQKGVSLFLTILILAIILAIVLGLGTILIGQIKTIREMGNSVIAFYAADAGVEFVLKDALDYIRGEGPVLVNDYNISVGEAFCKVELVCCHNSDEDCVFYEDGVDCPLIPPGNPDNEDVNCEANYFCIRSVGTYSNTKRAIEVEVFPVD